jgi:hypothetical protein
VVQRFSTATKETSGGVLATKPVLGDVGKIRGGQELLRDTEMSLKKKTEVKMTSLKGRTWF